MSLGWRNRYGSTKAPYYAEVANYSALPDASIHAGQIFIVLAGEWTGITYRRKGMWLSSGTSWSRLGGTIFGSSITVGTSNPVTISAGSIVATSNLLINPGGQLRFFDANTYVDSSGNIVAAGSYTDGAASSFTSGTTVGTLTFADGSITDSGGAIDFGDETLDTTNTITGGKLVADNVTIDGNTVSGGGNLHLTRSTSGNVTLGDGGNLHYIRVSSQGVTNFIGNAGYSYINCYGSGLTYSQLMANATWYTVTDNAMATGVGHGPTHDGNGGLTCTIQGRYWVTWYMTLETDTLIHTTISLEVNGTEVGDGRQEVEFLVADKEHNVSGTAILELEGNEKVTLGIYSSDASGAETVSVKNMGQSFVQIGGNPT